MALFRRRPEVTADVPVGFHATEATALQRSVLAALGLGQNPRPTVVPARLQVERGRDGVLVLVWDNVIVGFVPPERAAALRSALDVAGDAVVVVRGAAHRDGRTWRVWVGEVPPDGFPPVPEGHDTLTAPETTILGVPVRRLDGRG